FIEVPTFDGVEHEREAARGIESIEDLVETPDPLPRLLVRARSFGFFQDPPLRETNPTSHSPAAKLGRSDAHRDSKQEASQSRRIAQQPPAAIEAKENLLNAILDIRVRPDRAHQDPANECGVAVPDGRVRTLVTG